MEWPKRLLVRFSMFGIMTLVGVSCASSPFPKISEDGLVKVARTPGGAIYEAGGFAFAAFGGLVVDECSVRFRDSWQRDQNRNRGPSGRVTDEDMDQMRQLFAASCREILATELASFAVPEGEAADGRKVLAVRPAVIDVDIAAPDVLAAGGQTQYATTPAAMELRLDLVDTDTGQTVARVIDRRRADTTMVLRPATRVSNMAEVERVFRQWATRVREYLEASTER
jgi:hypothetical protein